MSLLKPEAEPRISQPGSLLRTVGLVESLAGFLILAVELLGTASTDWARVAAGCVLVLVGHIFVAVGAVLGHHANRSEGG